MKKINLGLLLCLSLTLSISYSQLLPLSKKTSKLDKVLSIKVLSSKVSPAIKSRIDNKNQSNSYDEMTIADLEIRKEAAVKIEDFDLASQLKLIIAKKQALLNVNLNVNTSVDSTVTLYNNYREKKLNELKNGSNLKLHNQDVTKVLTPDNKVNKIKLSNIGNNDNSNIIKYRRSSLYTLMIKNNAQEYTDVIINAFGNAPLEEKFNDHNIGPYLIDIQDDIKDQTANIDDYLKSNDVAKKIISKWFNRNEKGEFNMNLIAERGSYDASAIDISIANNSERGMTLLADAGEELIGNTFVIINDYNFTNKAEVAKKAGGFLNIISSLSSRIPGGEKISKIANYTTVGVGVVGKGYVIKTTSYLYQLVWNDEVASIFYNDCWVDKKDFSAQKKLNFEDTNAFNLRLVGYETAWADIQSTTFSNKSDKELIQIATVKATDKAIANLQRKYENFRTKTPLLSGSPIAAKIGLKEGLEKGDKFEVLEQVINKEGKTEYKRVGVIKVEKDQIWDNRYLANEENPSKLEYTTFSGTNNKFFAGMLIRQIN